MNLRLVIAVSCVLLLAPAGHAAAPRRVDRSHADAMALGHAALDAFLRRDFVTASRLYAQAAAIEPDVAEFVFGAARAEQEAGQTDAARGHFARVLDLTSEQHPLHVKAAGSLKALQPVPVAVAALPVAPTPETAQAPAPPVPTIAPVAPAPPAVTAAPLAPLHATSASPDRPWRRPAGWTAATIGVSAAAIGLGLGISAASAQSELDSSKMADGRYDLRQISYDEAVSRQGSINSRWTWTGVVGSVGIAALIAAGWWLLSPEPRRDGPTAASAAPN